MSAGRTYTPPEALVPAYLQFAETIVRTGAGRRGAAAGSGGKSCAALRLSVGATGTEDALIRSSAGGDRAMAAKQSGA